MPRISDTCRYTQIRADKCRYVQIRVDTLRADTRRYAQIRANTCRYAQIRADTCRYAQIRTDTRRYAQIRADACRYAQICSATASKNKQMLVKSAISRLGSLYIHFNSFSVESRPRTPERPCSARPIRQISTRLVWRLVPPGSIQRNRKKRERGIAR